MEKRDNLVVRFMTVASVRMAAFVRAVGPIRLSRQRHGREAIRTLPSQQRYQSRMDIYCIDKLELCRGSLGRVERVETTLLRRKCSVRGVSRAPDLAFAVIYLAAFGMILLLLNCRSLRLPFHNPKPIPVVVVCQ